VSAASSKAMAELFDGFNSDWIEFDKPETAVHGPTSLRAVMANLTQE
jgi:hypothetical protein